MARTKVGRYIPNQVPMYLLLFPSSPGAAPAERKCRGAEEDCETIPKVPMLLGTGEAIEQGRSRNNIIIMYADKSWYQLNLCAT